MALRKQDTPAREEMCDIIIKLPSRDQRGATEAQIAEAAMACGTTVSPPSPRAPCQGWLLSLALWLPLPGAEAIVLCALALIIAFASDGRRSKPGSLLVV